MIKFIKASGIYQHFNEENKHVFLENLSNKQAADIIFQLIKCKEFIPDSTLLHALLMGMWELYGYSDEDIQHVMEDFEDE